jgi:hypothetical protein
MDHFFLLRHSLLSQNEIQTYVSLAVEPACNKTSGNQGIKNVILLHTVDSYMGITNQ